MASYENDKVKKVEIRSLGPIFEGKMDCSDEDCDGKVIFFNDDELKACPECGKILRKDTELLEKPPLSL